VWHWRAQPSSLRRRLLAALVSSVVAISGVAAVLDYHRERKRDVDRILLSLEEQAGALEAACLLMTEPDDFGVYVDRYCATMDERISPGHHILILDPNGSVLAGSRHHSGPQIEQALLGTTGSRAVLDVDGHRLAYVRSLDATGRTFILAQYLDRVETALHEQLLRRAFLIVVTALTIVLFIYGAVTYWVIAPLEELMGAAQRWGGRDFSARAALRGPSDLRVVAREFNSMAGQLEVQEQRRLDELEEARQIQANLLPRLSARIGGLALAAEYRPAAHVAGDLYDVFGLPDGRTVVAVLDVCGHGISAALLTGVVKIALRHHVTACPDLSEALRRVNSDIVVCTSDRHFVPGIRAGFLSTRERRRNCRPPLLCSVSCRMASGLWNPCEYRPGIGSLFTPMASSKRRLAANRSAWRASGRPWSKPATRILPSRRRRFSRGLACPTPVRPRMMRPS
jgi:hypothetical protein